MRRSAFRLLVAAFCLVHWGPARADARASIVLIGGVKSEGPLRHDYPNGIAILKGLIEASPGLGGFEVRAFPDGWPDDPAAFDRAATVVWYFDGAERHPLLDRKRRARFEALARRGVGIVALHQSFTLPQGNAEVGIARWLGGVRDGLVDRVDATVELEPSRHAVARGLKPFRLADEFYPTIGLGPGARPVLRADGFVAAWAFERPGGGRAFAFSGMHYLVTLDAAPARILLLNAILWTTGRDVPPGGVHSGLTAAARVIAARLDHPTFHHDAQRGGWNAMESALTPAVVASGAFGLLWESPAFDGHEGQAPRLYASPLYLDRVAIATEAHRETFSVAFAATNAGYVYAVNAFPTRTVPAGAILWRTRLGDPCRLQPAPLDGIPTGVLATPVIDPARGILYVTHCDPRHRWQAYALDIATGAIVAGWPVRLDEATFNAPGMNRNAGPTVLPPRRRHDYRVQRGALNLSPDGAFLYAAFGESETGWIVSVDTRRAQVASAFATQAIPHRGSGGVWGAGGAAVDADGDVYIATGTGFGGYVDNANDWSQSVLRLAHAPGAGFALRGTYTPFNHCQSAAMDIDLGSGGVSLLPASSLMAVGGKQGNVYLLDRARLPGRLDRRPPCGEDSALDGSLLPPGAQPQFGRRGPLNVFGPYSEKDAAMDLARARSVPAAFRDARGRTFVFVTGSSKRAEGSPESVPPSIARLEVVERGAAAPYLRVDQAEGTLVFENPGSPLVSSDGPREAIVWVLDENARRSAPLDGPLAPRPVLYALDAMSLAPLWRSRPGELHTSGKYNQPVVARGRVILGTDRLQAFGVGTPRAARGEPRADPPAAAPRSPAPRPAARAPAALYAQRCASCHDEPQGSIPPREWIAGLPRARVVEALSQGPMRAFAADLAPEEIDALAEFLR
jgi:mono/diheme cytochrome c family protein